MYTFWRTVGFYYSDMWSFCFVAVFNVAVAVD
jgi:hypothetical protein